MDEMGFRENRTPVFKAQRFSSINASITAPQANPIIPLPSSSRISKIIGFEAGKSILSGRARYSFFFWRFFRHFTRRLQARRRRGFWEAKKCQVQRRDAGGRSVIESNILIERGQVCMGTLSKGTGGTDYTEKSSVVGIVNRLTWHLHNAWLFFRPKSQIKKTPHWLPGHCSGLYKHHPPPTTFHIASLFVINIPTNEIPQHHQARRLYDFAPFIILLMLIIMSTSSKVCS